MKVKHIHYLWNRSQQISEQSAVINCQCLPFVIFYWFIEPTFLKHEFPGGWARFVGDEAKELESSRFNMSCGISKQIRNFLSMSLKLWFIWHLKNGILQLWKSKFWNLNRLWRLKDSMLASHSHEHRPRSRGKIFHSSSSLWQMTSQLSPCMHYKTINSFVSKRGKKPIIHISTSGVKLHS